MKMRMIVVGAIVATLVMGVSPLVYAQNTDNFSITNYDVAMQLSRDSENRSTLRATETITAVFPQTNQNRGLERVFVKEYDDHSTSFALESVTDENGKKLPHHWSGDALRIGDADTYVHGEHTYVITYSQRDVTRYYRSTDRDEFYWDIIGGDWRVPIERANVSVTVDPALMSARQGDAHCYHGAFRSSDRCEITAEANSFVSEVEDIGDRRGVTFALGFAPETFAKYETPLIQKIMMGAMAFGFVGGVITFLVTIPLVIMRWFRSQKRNPEINAILDRPLVVEYIPPANHSVLESTHIYNAQSLSGKGVPAQIIDWAIRHYLNIYETKEKGLFSQAEYKFEVKKSFTSLSKPEQSLAKLLFGHVPNGGETITTSALKKKSLTLSRGIESIARSIKNDNTLYETDKEAVAWYKRAALILVVLGFVFVFNILLFFLAGILWFVGAASRFKTVEGTRLKRYLDGLKEYIRAAETDRIQMLQSPEGAEKVGGVDPKNNEMLIKLYERVLPYAVLFGQEKEWSKRLGDLYESTESVPTWYTGQSAFNAAMFGSMVDSVSSQTSSASSYSSSSGGSGGGGFSGGGGGGGGGGGW